MAGLPGPLPDLARRGETQRPDRPFRGATAQAALDFRVYLELAAAPPTYDPVRKTYVAAPHHQPLSPCSLTDAFDISSDGNKDSCRAAATFPGPERRADPSTISRLYQALRAGKMLHLRYISISPGADEAQWIAPVQFISDGESVYLRGYSYKHLAYRNYLPIRIEPDSSFAERHLDDSLPFDEDWFTLAAIWLRPQSGLSDEQARVVRREYGFTGEWLCIETRKALEYFFDHRWALEGARLERVRTDYRLIAES